MNKPIIPLDTSSHSPEPPVWPPAPKAPDGPRYSFAVPGMEGTRIGDRLVLNCHGMRRGLLWRGISGTLIMCLGFRLPWTIMDIWNATRRGHFHSLVYSIPIIGIAALFLCFYSLMLWRMYAVFFNRGVFNFYWDDKLAVGYCDPLGALSSVLRIEEKRGFLIVPTRYVVNIHTGTSAEQSKQETQSFGNQKPKFISLSFLKREDAKKIVQEIMDVTGAETLQE